MSHFNPSLRGLGDTPYSLVGAGGVLGSRILYGASGASAARGVTTPDDRLVTQAAEKAVAAGMTASAALHEADRPRCTAFLQKNPKVLQAAGAAGVDASALQTACESNYSGFVKAMDDQGLTTKWYADKRVLIGGGIAAALALYLVMR